MKYGLSEEQLAEICNIIGSYPQIEAAVIHGSRADGAYKEASDVDIAIKGEKTNESLAAKLKFHLEEETYLPFFFDVIAYNAITSTELKNQIKVKGKTIYRRGWIYTKLGEIIKLGNGMARPKTEGKNPLYGGNGILGYSSESNYDGDTIIIGRVGRYCGSVYFEDKPIWISDNALSAKPKGNHNIKFLYYFLKNLNLNKMAQGSSHPLITQTLLNSTDIFICNNVAEQRAIAEVLSSLDDKIDLLHRQNKTLENMTQILFQKWFIDDADEAWEEKKLVKIMDINPKYNLKKGTVAPYLEMSNMDVNSHTPLNWYNRAFKSGMRFQNGDTLFARITPCLENGKTCFVDFLKENEIGWGSTEYIIMRSKPNLPPLLSYVIAKNNTFRNYAIGTMSGTSGRQRAQATSLEEYPIYIPPPIILEKFSKQCEDITLKLKNNTLQLRALNATRDALLPKLMNGEARVKQP